MNRTPALSRPESSLLKDVGALAATADSVSEMNGTVCKFLRANVPHYNWVGIYMLEGDTLVLRGWDGPAATEHTRIPVGQGICGLAARTKETVNVPDVNEDPRYLSCFLNTRSELVVPMMQGTTCVGEIDIDSDKVGAFAAWDEEFVGKVAAILVKAGSALAR